MSDDDQITGQQPQVVDEPTGQQDDVVPASEETLSPEPEVVEDGLPETVSDRTRQEFEKLKESNRKLKEELEATRKTQEYGESVFNSFTPKESELEVQQPAEITEDYIDSDGNVDVARLNKALKDANKRARQALELANIAAQTTKQADEARQVQDAHAKHDWLNPQSSNFDPIAYDAVVARMARYMQQGRKPNLVEVADEVRSAYQPRGVSDEAKKQAVDEYKQSQTVKAQVQVSDGRGQPRQETTRMEDLRERSLDGDISALDERIRLATSG